MARTGAFVDEEEDDGAFTAEFAEGAEELEEGARAFFDEEEEEELFTAEGAEDAEELDEGARAFFDEEEEEELFTAEFAEDAEELAEELLLRTFFDEEEEEELFTAEGAEDAEEDEVTFTTSVAVTVRGARQDWSLHAWERNFTVTVRSPGAALTEASSVSVTEMRPSNTETGWSENSNLRSCAAGNALFARVIPSPATDTREAMSDGSCGAFELMCHGASISALIIIEAVEPWTSVTGPDGNEILTGFRGWEKLMETRKRNERKRLVIYNYKIIKMARLQDYQIADYQITNYKNKNCCYHG